LIDTDKEIRKKINKAYSEDGKAEGNGLLAITRYVLFKFLEQEQRPH
jgi:tyrosyl-tRNA synthetase